MSAAMEPWIQTRTDRQAWPLSLAPEQVDIVDIAHALAHLCRFTGHCRRFYSVAEHSVWVSLLVAPENALAGLLHDAAEAYLGDCSAPIKQFTYFKIGEDYVSFKDVERSAHRAICAALDVSPEIPAEVKEADLRMLMTEKEELLGPSPTPWAIDAAPLKGLALNPITPVQGYQTFLGRYMELTKGRAGGHR